MRRPWFWPGRRRVQPLAPPASSLQSWIDAFAVANRPVMRSAESELVILAQIVCRSMQIPPGSIPTPEQQAEIEATVSEWIRNVRLQAADTVRRSRPPSPTLAPRRDQLRSPDER